MIYTILYRVCVVCLSPKHSLVTSQAGRVKGIEFHSGNTDRTANKVTGKRKNKLFRVVVNSSVGLV